METIKALKIKFQYILGLFFLTDIVNKYFPDYNLSLIVKSIFLGYLLTLTLLRNVVKELWVLGGIVFFFICSHGYMIFLENVDPSKLLDNIRLLGLYLFPLAFAFNFEYLHNISYKKKGYTYVFLDSIIFIVVTTTCLGFFFEIDSFKTYFGTRFGFMGILPKSITASFFYIFSILYLFDRKRNLLLIVTLITSLLVGTKSILLFLVLFFIYFVISKKKYNLAGALLFLSILFGAKILEVTKSVWYPFYDLYERVGIMTSLTSFRSDIFKDLSTVYMKKWSLFNYFFGGRIIVDDLFEMALFDCFSFFGIAGGTLYVMVYIQTIKFNSRRKYLFFAIFTVLIIGSLSGQYFLNSSIAFYSVLFFYYISHKKYMKENNSENNRINILNTVIDNLSMVETVKHIDGAITRKNQIHHVVVNAGKIVALQKDLELRKSVNGADLINADGQAVVWAAKLLGIPIKERVAGIDLMENLVSQAYEKKYKIFFFGAKEEIVKKVVETYTNRYDSSIIAGYRNGYFNKNQETGIAKQIVNSGANILFVAISSPTKENFLFQNKETLSKVNFTMGVGGSFDVVAGLVKRAPVWMQRIGLEWFYRFLQEPRRMWKRYLVGNSKFIFLVLKEKFKSMN